MAKQEACTLERASTVRKASQPSAWAIKRLQKYMLEHRYNPCRCFLPLSYQAMEPENIKVIANGHGFRDMDIVYISNSADAAGDAAPLTPSGQRLFYVESASQDAFYLNNSMALAIQHGNVQFAKLNTSKIGYVVGFVSSTIHLKSVHSFDTGDILVTNGTLRRVTDASGGGWVCCNIRRRGGRRFWLL